MVKRDFTLTPLLKGQSIIRGSTVVGIACARGSFFSLNWFACDAHQNCHKFNYNEYYTCIPGYKVFCFHCKNKEYVWKDTNTLE